MQSSFFILLSSFDVVGVPKNATGRILGKVHLIPLQSVPHLLTFFNVRDRNVLRAVQVCTMFYV
jgi:hypothetical protein